MRAQLAIEFLFLIAVAFLALLVYTASTRQDVMRAESAKEYALVKDLSYALQSEVNRAGSLEDGYVRGFDLPATLEGIPYSMTILQNTLIVNSSEYEYTLTVLPASGNFTQGANVVKKQAGSIIINQ